MNTTRHNFSRIDFNQKFEEDKELTKQISKEREKERLDYLSAEKKHKMVTQLSISEILIGIKDTWFDLIDDLLQGKFNITTFTQDNRLFFIGITIVILVLIIYIFYILTATPDNNNNENKIVKIYHVYPNKLTPNNFEFSETIQEDPFFNLY